MEEEILKKVEIFLKKHNLANSSKTFIVGFSGGADSLCLLDSLNELSKTCGFRIIACHLNHNWRKEAFDEEKRAKEYCESREIEFFSKVLPDDVPKTELAAREERYKFFEEAVLKFKADAIFTGHTKDDNTETILYRIIKGTGIKGLCGIPESRLQGNIQILRPLLSFSRENIEEYCNEKGLVFSEDKSNLDEKYFRNKIRHSLLPLLEKDYNAEVRNSILRLSNVSKDYYEIVENRLDDLKEKIYRDDSIITLEFNKLLDSEKRLVIHDLLDKKEIDFSFEKIEDILSFINKSKNLKNGNTLSIATNTWIFVSKKEIKVIYKIKDNVLKSGLNFKLKDGVYFNEDLKKTLKVTIYKDKRLAKFPQSHEMKAFVDLKEIEQIEFRTRRSGDIIQPFGMQGKMKLKKFFIDRGIPEYQRDEVPVIAIGNEVLWVAGVGLSEKVKVTSSPSHMLEIK